MRRHPARIPEEKMPKRGEVRGLEVDSYLLELKPAAPQPDVATITDAA